MHGQLFIRMVHFLLDDDDDDHYVIIHMEGLDLTLPILPCLQFFGHGGEITYSKIRIEKCNCKLPPQQDGGCPLE